MTKPRPATVRVLAQNTMRLVRDRRPPFVLCYHAVEAGDGSDPHGLRVAPEAFAAQLDALLEAGYTLVTAGELWERVERRGPRAARGLGAITFDDGLAESLRLAAAMAAQRDVRLTAYVPSALLGLEHPDLPGRAIVHASRLRELADAGMEIGGHSATHADLAALEPERAAAELRESRVRLQEILDRPVRGMAYPFGRYTPATIAATRAAGYGYACACAGAGPWRQYEIPREPIFPSTSVLRVRIKAAGLYGPVHALQRRRGGA